MRAVLFAVVLLCVAAHVSAANRRTNGLREALGHTVSVQKFAGANICTISVCGVDVEVQNAANVIPALVKAAGKAHIAIDAFQQTAPPGAAEGVTGSTSKNAAAKARAKKAVADIVQLATASNCNEVNVLGHGANNKIGFTFNAPDPTGQAGAFVPLPDIYAGLAAVGAISKINFMVCLCNVPPAAKLGLCENRIVSAGYRNGAGGFVAMPAITLAGITQQLNDAGNAAPTPADINQAYHAYTQQWYDPIFQNYANNPKTAAAQNVPLFRQIVQDYGGQVDFLTPNAGNWASAKIT